VNDDTDHGRKTPAKASSHGPTEEELMEIRALYAQADAMAQDMPPAAKPRDGSEVDNTDQHEQLHDSDEDTSMPAFSVVGKDREPEQGDPR